MASGAEIWFAPDGTPVTIRAIGADDLDLEREFVNGLSRATGYQRLMSARTPSLEELRRFTDVDPARETALIALTATNGREREIGVARYVRDENSAGAAEFAIVLADDWQRRGLGRKLLASLIDDAKRHGVRRLVGTTLSHNEGMLRLARRLGFSLALDPASASVTNIALDLAQMRQDVGKPG